MAEIAVSFVVDKLVPLLAGKANSLRGVRKEFAGIQRELASIRSFLKDADERAETEEIDDGVRTWVKQVRGVSHQIEDVIDEYLLHFPEQPHRRHGFIRFFYKVTLCINKLMSRNDIASQIQDIRTTIQEITELRERYKLNSFEQGSSSCMKNDTWNDPRLASLFIEEDEVVGIDSSRKKLIERLVTGESKRSAIALVGMGGVGKTTLARKVYDNPEVAVYFDCCSWIPVSQSYKRVEILRKMIKEFYESREEHAPEGINTMEETSLITKVRQYLHQKRYVIVFDDVWDIEFCGFIKNALPDNHKGSRVIITTRSDDVAALCNYSSFDRVLKLQPLSQDKAWELFCKKVFQSETEGLCPRELKELSLEIVRKCEGLPLAIVTIGGLLLTKNRDVSEWRKLCCGLGHQLERNPHLTNITRVIFLSYHDLPYHLKSCFLYLSITPEDYSIGCGRLIRLWTAEGFIKEEKGKTLEEVAEEYLTELVHRSLVQVSEELSLKKFRSCRVHDLVREIILSKSKELSFCEVLQEMDLNSIQQVRRLSVHGNVDDDVWRTINSRIRSLFLYGMNDKLPNFLLDSLAEKFKLLKVLDFEGAPVNYLPIEVGNLFHLAYLSLRGTKVKTLPKSIGKLNNLLTLDLKYSLVDELPIEINRLRKLRYLCAYCSTTVTKWDDYGMFLQVIEAVKIQEGIGNLQELQKLYMVDASESGAIPINDLKNLRQLRKLGITYITGKDFRAICTAIEEMKYLKSLELSSDEIMIMDLQLISSPPQYLQNLWLGGPLEKLPDWVPKLQNLVKLVLWRSRFTADPLKALHVLPNLSLLHFNEVYDGEKLHFEVGGFQKLKDLQLLLLNRLKEMVIDEGALPHLAKLRIAQCSQLEAVPSGIYHLTDLTKLHFLGMPNEFTDRLKPTGGQDYWIVKRIPDVGCWTSSEGGRFKKHTLSELNAENVQASTTGES